MTTAPPCPLADAFLDRPDAGLLVGFSGGLDSAVLLHALASDPAARGQGLRAVHIHHGLQAGADEWARHCERFCALLGVALKVLPVDVRSDGGGLEAAARVARHNAFQRIAGSAEVVVLGHHRDDQAETFLLRALRGSGVDGLAAIRRWRRFGDTRLWRPLLETPRAALLDYARAHGLTWIEDPSNADERFDRNFLRQQVLPLLRTRWPHADAAFARSAALCDQAGRLLAVEDAAVLAEVRHGHRTLSRSALLALGPQRRARVLRRWIAELALPPLPANGVARIDADLLPARADASARFEWDGAVVHAWRDILHAAPVRAGLPGNWSIWWDGTAALPLPDGGQLMLEGASALEQPCRVSARRGGERIVLPGRDHGTAVKHLLQDLGAPPWQRPHLPLLAAADGTLLAVADLACAAGFQAWLNRHDARLRWRPASH